MKQASNTSEVAPRTSLCIENLDGLNEEQKTILRTYSSNKAIDLYSLPNGNICVPSLTEDVSDCPFVHVMNGKVIIVSFSYSLKGGFGGK